MRTRRYVNAGNAQQGGQGTSPALVLKLLGLAALGLLALCVGVPLIVDWLGSFSQSNQWMATVTCVSPLVSLAVGLLPVLSVRHRLSPARIQYEQEVKAREQEIRAIDDEFRKQQYQYEMEKRQNQSRSLSDLRGMTPRQFEHHIAYIFQRMGYTARPTGTTGDGGVDVEARRDGELVVVQCKRFDQSTKVSSPALRNFVGAMSVKKANKGYFVTTGSFTEPAIREARQTPSLVLIDGIKLLDWWQEYKIGPYRTGLTPPTRREYPQPPTPPAPEPPPTILGLGLREWVIAVILAQIALWLLLLVLSQILAN